MRLKSYLYVNRGIEYDLPFIPVIKALDLFCDKVLVGSDPRFEDRTIEEIQDHNFDNVDLFLKEFNYNVENPHGHIKQILRNQLETGEDTWFLDIDADEFIFPKEGQKLRNFLAKKPERLNLISLPETHFFNGNFVKLAEPQWRSCLSESEFPIKHGAPDRMGSGYMTMKERPYYSNFRFSSVTIYHYGWYSLPRKWEMKQTLHYYKGRLDGVYKGLADYEKNLDGEEVNFWDVHWRLPLEEYTGAIIAEMEEESIKKTFHRHHPFLQDWIDRQRVMKYWKWNITKLGFTY